MAMIISGGRSVSVDGRIGSDGVAAGSSICSRNIVRSVLILLHYPMCSTPTGTHPLKPSDALC